MSWKRSLMELLVAGAAKARFGEVRPNPKPSSIFVLRNNDIGDLLVITPLFEALRRSFPNAKIAAGIGDWNRPVLENNPNISTILSINAPWHNKFVTNQSLPSAFKYICFSKESGELARQRFDIGIDVLGSQLGSLLLIRAGIPTRLGVKGYAGGHSAAQRVVAYNPLEHVGDSALRFARLLTGDVSLPVAVPQIFLSEAEKEQGQAIWNSLSPIRSKTRIVIGPGGGFVEKCWPHSSFLELGNLLKSLDLEIVIVGGKRDVAIGNQLADAIPASKALTGQLTLRETFGVVAASDIVICNSSMLMHVAAAFSVRHLVLLGDYFGSAKAHQKQWGYDGLSLVLGKNQDRPQIFSAAEVFAILKSELAKRSSN